VPQHPCHTAEGLGTLDKSRHVTSAARSSDISGRRGAGDLTLVGTLCPCSTAIEARWGAPIWRFARWPAVHLSRGQNRVRNAAPSAMAIGITQSHTMAATSAHSCVQPALSSRRRLAGLAAQPAVERRHTRSLICLAARCVHVVRPCPASDVAVGCRRHCRRWANPAACSSHPRHPLARSHTHLRHPRPAGLTSKVRQRLSSSGSSSSLGTGQPWPPRPGPLRRCWRARCSQ
jgi:hypothetical protein